MQSIPVKIVLVDGATMVIAVSVFNPFPIAVGVRPMRSVRVAIAILRVRIFKEGGIEVENRGIAITTITIRRKGTSFALLLSKTTLYRCR